MAVVIGEYVPSNCSGMGRLRNFPRVHTIILNITLVFLMVSLDTATANSHHKVNRSNRLMLLCLTQSRFSADSAKTAVGERCAALSASRHIILKNAYR